MRPAQLFTIVGMALSTVAATSGPPVIGRIEIRVYDVFGEGEEPEFWLYRTANQLHVRSREHIIRQELLFAQGDPVDEEALAQTERNLRALVFIRDARVTAHPRDDGAVDVVVETYDAWTTVPELRLARVGNEWEWALGASEKNLLGRGKQVEVSRRKDLERRETLFLYRDPRVRGSRIGLDALYSTRSDGERGFFSLGRPFYSLATEWAFGAQIEGFDQLDPLYADGARIGSLRHVRRRAELEWAWAVKRAPSHALRFHLAYRSLEDEVETDLRDFGIVEVGVSVIEHRFMKLDHIHRFERHEDFNLGYRGSAFLGFSSGGLGGEPGESLFLFLQGGRGFRLGPEHFLLAGASWRARLRRSAWENSLSVYRLDYANRLNSRQLVVSKAQLVYGRRLDPEIQLTMGAESGLRGYPVHQFVGSRSLLLSAEHRVFLVDELWNLVSLGLGFFIDSGFAWREAESIDLRDLRSNVGVGLLVGKNRIDPARPTVRFDVAYALDPVPGQSRWLFSAGSQIGF